LDNGEPPCITFAGLSLDEAISREIMIVLEPAAIEAAVLATEQETLQQEEIISALKRELEATQYTARRAETVRHDRSRQPLSGKRTGASVE